MNGGIFNKRIPTFFVVLLLLGILFPTVHLINKETNLKSLAGINAEIHNLEISNVKNSSFTVAFTTTKKTKALVILNGANDLETLILDDRDKSTGIQKEYFTHFITIPNLRENTKYDFQILVDGKIYNDQTFEGYTGSIIKGLPKNLKTASGRVFLPNGNSSPNSLVVLSSNKSQILATLTDGEGRFKVDLKDARNDSSKLYYPFKSNEPLKLKIYNQNLTTEINADYSVVQKLPNITLGNNYKFSKFDEKLASPSAFFRRLQPISSKEIDALKLGSTQTTKSSTMAKNNSNKAGNVLGLNSARNKDLSSQTSASEESKILESSFMLAGFSLVLIFIGVSLLFAL